MENQKEFNLNDCVLFKMCYDQTEANLVVKRSVRPMIKSINKAIKENEEAYNNLFKEALGGKDVKGLTEDEQKEVFTKFNDSVYEHNKKVFPEFILERNSTHNFFIRFWTPFMFDPKTNSPFTIKEADRLDENIVEIYPDLDVNLDAEEETVEENKVENATEEKAVEEVNE